MVTREFICPKGHITVKIVPVSQPTNPIRCSKRRCRKLAEQFFSKAPHPHSGKLIWTATEVHGKKKAASESFAADIERACFDEKGLQR
jgi:hypothetical protein